MGYPTPDRLVYPVTPYECGNQYRFGQRLRRHGILWMTHLGDDLVAAADQAVVAAGAGEVVFADTRPGSSTARNWGGVVIIAHTHPSTHEPFYSVYGHLYQLLVRVGQSVVGGQPVGAVAPGQTPENGWWAIPHLHFGIYAGPWRGGVLPGYKRLTHWWKTRLSWWHDPKVFIDRYNQRRTYE